MIEPKQPLPQRLIETHVFEKDIKLTPAEDALCYDASCKSPDYKSDRRRYIQMRSIERLPEFFQQYPLLFVESGTSPTRNSLPSDSRKRAYHPLERYPDHLYFGLTPTEWDAEFNEAPKTSNPSTPTIQQQDRAELKNTLSKNGLAEMNEYKQLLDTDELVVVDVKRDYLHELALHTNLSRLEAQVKIFRNTGHTLDDINDYIDLSRYEFTPINQHLNNECPTNIKDILPYDSPQTQSYVQTVFDLELSA